MPEVKFPIAERFKAPQGEGLFTGTPMAFVRLVGCSVGKKVCTHCDTEFDRTFPHLGGGMYTSAELLEWAHPYRHLCLTGGEPLDRDVRPIIEACMEHDVRLHVETSGTKHPDWLGLPVPGAALGRHMVAFPDVMAEDQLWREVLLWVTVSPKPGYLDEMVEQVADELKVIVGGLGDGPGWPTINDAVDWSESRRDRPVYVQPRNNVLTLDEANLQEALRVIDRWPQLRLSSQLHKVWRTR